MRLLITRPRADAQPLAEQLLGLGHQVVMEPLLDIRFLAMDDADMARILDGAQGLLVTSANGLRAFAQASSRRDIAVYAVGRASAAAAHEAGFSDVDSADGDVVTLANRAVEKLHAGDGALVHVAGSRLAGDLAGLLEKDGFDVRRAVLYEAIKVGELSPSVQADLADGKIDGVLLFSPRTAESFVGLVEQAGLSGHCGDVTAYCLSEAVAEKARAIGWARLAVAAHPDQRSLIETIEEE